MGELSTAGPATPEPAAPAAPARLVPPWIWAAGIALAAWPLMVRTEWLAGVGGLDAVDSIRLVLEAAALTYGARRADLPRGVRATLAALAAISVGSAIDNLLVVGEVGWWTSPLTRGWYLVSYVTGAAALLLWPRVPARRGQGATLTIDALVTAGGLGVLMWVFAAAPQAGVDSGALTWPRIAVAAQVALLLGLNLVVLRGRAVPSRAGFWWFVAGQAAYIPLVLVEPWARTGSTFGGWLLTTFYYWGVVPTLLAMVHVRRDPIDARVRGGAGAALLELNPVALITPIMLGVALAASILGGATVRVLPLGLTLVVITLLLVLRLLMSARENTDLMREQATVAAQIQAAKSDAVGRLAGGIAHEFNNLMTSVIGYAELGALDVAPDAPLHADLVRIQEAGQRAAALTAMLLQSSGRQPDRRQLMDVAVAVDALAPRLTALGPVATVRVATTAPAVAFVDPEQLEQLVRQLVANARDASPPDGEVQVKVTTVDLDAAVATSTLSVGAGRYVVVEVGDRGRGIAAAEVPLIFDPFYSLRPEPEAAGLGLAAVYGIVAAHGGGIAVDSTLGQGTTMRVFLPVEPPAAMSALAPARLGR